MNNTLLKFIAATLVASSLLFAGCNTMKGLGEDVETLGEKMQGESE